LPLRRSTALAFAALIWLAACATAGDGEDDSIGGSGPDAAVGSPDAPTGGFPDAPTGGFPDAAPGTLDASPIPGTPDAAPIPGTPDAAPGPFCTANNQCPVSGECCFRLDPNGPGFCTPGAEFGDLCFPN
jgi:hypothetical protein